MRHLTPPGIRPPFARYSYGVEIPPDHRILVCSGQLGIAPDDQVPATVEEQTHLCFRNIGAVLKQASFTFADIVRINAFVVAREHLKGYMSVRDLYITDPPPASTLVIVSGFSRPEFLVEVEIIAAAP
jgi:enamine deaminase RidA (YjgF/YER057c/UK114 family)